MEYLLNGIRSRIGEKLTWEKKEILKLIEGYEGELHDRLEKDGKIIIVRTNKWFSIKAEDLKIGDITTVTIGNTPHPGIIWKIKENDCYCICLSSTMGAHVIGNIENSRLLKGYFTNTIMKITKKDAITGFFCEFDNKRELKRIFSLFKRYYYSFLKEK